MKTVFKAFTTAAVAAVLAVTMGCAAVPGSPVTDGSNMGWNAPNQNG